MKQAHIKTQTVLLEKIYPHSLEQVWRALTDPAALSQWLLPTSFRPKPGQRFHFTRRRQDGKPQKVRCQIVELDAPHRLAYTWQAEGEAIPSLVVWTLEAVEEGVRLRLEHLGPPAACANANFRACAAVPLPCFLSPFAPSVQEQVVLSRQTSTTVRSARTGRIVLSGAWQPAPCMARPRRAVRTLFTASQEDILL